MELLFLVMVIALAAMMFLSSTRQRRGVKALEQMQSSLAPGDRVLTTAGLYATVKARSESTVDLELAPGVVTTWDIRVIRERLDADEPDNASGEHTIDSDSAPHTGSTDVDDTPETR